MQHSWRNYRRIIVAALVLHGVVAHAKPGDAGPHPATDMLAALPLAFEENKGQADPSVKFSARVPGYDLYLTSSEAVFVVNSKRRDKPAPTGQAKGAGAMTPAVVRMRFAGANKSAAVTGLDPFDYQTSYLRGPDTEKHLTGIASHRRVRYSSIYPGVDVVYYGKHQQLEYDLHVAPGAGTEQIRLQFDGVKRVALAAGGKLRLLTTAGEMEFLAPVAYQDIDGQRRAVASRYTLAANGGIGFVIGQYDRTKPLVIDPILSYSSFLWGSTANGIAVDPAGNAYVVGYLNTTDLPATGGYQTGLLGDIDAYVVKLDSAGKRVYATYLGVRRSQTLGEHIAIDGSGNAYITGTTNSASFPVTTGAYQATYAAGGSFVTKLNATGSALAYSTFFNYSKIAGIAVDASGNAYLAGMSASIATTPGAYLRSISGNAPFVAKLNASGSATAYATYLSDGGTSEELRAIAIDASGNAYLTGRSVGAIPSMNGYQAYLAGGYDAFVTKLDATGSALLYSTYLGGAANDVGNGIAVDALGQVHVAGTTNSSNFPVTAGVFQPAKGHADPSVSNAFIAKLGANGDDLIYSSYLGGRWCLQPGVYSCMSMGGDGVDGATEVAVDGAGYAYVGGFATSVLFPQVDLIQPVSQGGDESRAPFVAKVRPDGAKLVYAIVLGARAQDEKLNGLAIDANGSAYAVGYNGWATSDYPVTAAPLMATGSAFIFKLSTGKYPTTVRPTWDMTTQRDEVTLTADLLTATPGATVTFYDGETVLGTVAAESGSASLVTVLPAGLHKITAVHSADGIRSPVFVKQIYP